MKKHLFICLFLLFNCPGFAQSKIAHVKGQQLIDTLPSHKKAMAEIRELTKLGETELIEKDKELQKAYSDYIAKKDSQSATANQYEENRLQKMQQDLQNREQELNQNLRSLTAKNNDKTYKMLKDAVKAIAIKEGFQYVIDGDTALYAGGTDITSKVIAELLHLDSNNIK